jgi:hypothetical protein
MRRLHLQQAAAIDRAFPGSIGTGKIESGAKSWRGPAAFAHGHDRKPAWLVEIKRELNTVNIRKFNLEFNDDYGIFG